MPRSGPHACLTTSLVCGRDTASHPGLDGHPLSAVSRIRRSDVELDSGHLSVVACRGQQHRKANVTVLQQSHPVLQDTDRFIFPDVDYFIFGRNGDCWIMLALDNTTGTASYLVLAIHSTRPAESAQSI